MAKVDPLGIDPEVLPIHRGFFHVVRTAHGFVAKKWPRKRGKAKTPEADYLQKQFGYAARMASNSEPIQYETAVNLTAGTEYMPRDLLLRAAYGKAYEIVTEDGTHYTAAPHGYPVAPTGRYQSVLLTKNLNQTLPAGTTTDLLWQVQEYDDLGFFDPLVSDTFITIPSGVTRVSAAAGIRLTSATTSYLTLSMRLNGTSDYPGSPYMYARYSHILALYSPPIEVVPGDQLKVTAYSTYGRTADAIGNTYFSVTDRTP